MAGNLIQVATNTVTSAVPSVSILGITTDDIYMVALNNVAPATDSAYLRMRFTKASDDSADSSSNYDRAAKELRADAGFANSASENQNGFKFIENGTATRETHNGIQYLFNFNNSSEYSVCTFEEASLLYDTSLRGRNGGGSLTVAQATNGVNYFYSSGNIASGTFTLYKVV